MSTARGVARLQAPEMQRREAERIATDPCASRFADPLPPDLTRLSVAVPIPGNVRSVPSSRPVRVAPDLALATVRVHR